jgi:hypothetical protein
MDLKRRRLKIFSILSACIKGVLITSFFSGYPPNVRRNTGLHSCVFDNDKRHLGCLAIIMSKFETEVGGGGVFSAVLPAVLGHPPPLQLLLLLLLPCCCYLTNVDVCQVKEECPRRFCLVCWDTPPPFQLLLLLLLLLFN